MSKLNQAVSELCQLCKKSCLYHTSATSLCEHEKFEKQMKGVHCFFFKNMVAPRNDVHA